MNATTTNINLPTRRSTPLGLIGLSVLACLSVLAVTFTLTSNGHANHVHHTHAAIESVSWMQDDDGQAVEQTSDGTDAEDSATQQDAPVEPVISVPSVATHFYHARVVELPESGFTTLGDIDDKTQKTVLEFTHQGAGISALRLPDDFETVKGEKHVELQQETPSADGSFTVVPFAALNVHINGESVLLTGTKTQSVWAEVSPGVFEAFVDDEDANPVLRIQRTFTLKPSTEHGFIFNEFVENLSGDELRVRLVSTGPIDMPKAKTTYAGDRRRVRYGYLLSPERQSTSLTVSSDEELKSRNKLLGKKETTQYGKAYPSTLRVWPNEDLLPHSSRLSWLALSDRYFVIAMHPHFDFTTVQSADEKLFTGYNSIDRLVMDPYADPINAVVVLQMIGDEHVLATGDTYNNTFGVYAGPRNRPVMNKEPVLAALNMPTMVVSNLGGMCAPCTFSWLTDILIGVLRTFHSIVGDWAVSIFLLVILVRSCLHPVTRWSQIRVQRFSVQMQEMAPKQKLIREKYKNDSKKQQAEMSKLWKEEGISPAGMLGCLPMFLQSPVWIALYATLFFASELRHEPAFYGVFQDALNWQFMNDLSAPDGAIPLPASMHFSFPMWGNVNSVNILPLFLGFVMFAHQKYLTPPTQATMTPEQKSQQKMMKVMTIGLFPIMMYAAPSGLALYFITNSTIAVIENKWIRSHMKKHGMLEIENIRASKKDKGPGFLQRMTDAAEAQRQLKEKGPAQPNPASKNSRRGKP